MSPKEPKIAEESKNSKVKPPSLGKDLPPNSIKSLEIGPDTPKDEKTLKEFLPIIEMVVRKEYKSIPSYLAEYSELVNVGLITVNKLIHDVAKSKKKYNSSYIAQAVKWAIKDELRTKYNWYGVKQNKGAPPTPEGGEGDAQQTPQQEVQEKIFESILYFEDMTVEKAPEEMSQDELARLEIRELKNAVKKAISKLPEKHRRVMEMRYYENKKGNDVAAELGVTPSRISHMIQDAIVKVKQMLEIEGYV